MRQYNIIFGILLILPFIDFTLAAPIPAQGGCQTCIDAVHIPRDVLPVLEERGSDDELGKMVQQFEKWTIEDPHASSSSAPSGPEHGSMNNGQQPAQSTPTANPDSFVEPSSPSSTASSTDSSTLTASGSDAEFWNPLLNTGDPGYQGDIVLPADLGLPLQEDMAADGHHVDDVQQPDPGQWPQENGVLNGHHVDDLQQPNPGQWPQENGVANGHWVDHWHVQQLPDPLVEPSSPSSASYSLTSSDYEIYRGP